MPTDVTEDDDFTLRIGGMSGQMALHQMWHGNHVVAEKERERAVRVLDSRVPGGAGTTTGDLHDARTSQIRRLLVLSVNHNDRVEACCRLPGERVEGPAQDRPTLTRGDDDCEICGAHVTPCSDI